MSGVILMKKILVLGASGFIGKAICKELKNEYEVYGTYYSNKAGIEGMIAIKLDISKDDQIMHVLETVEPDIVISSLRGDYVYQLRAHENMANYLKENGIRLIYISTANVYDAVTDKAHPETDVVSSKSDYGKFKITCEQLLQDILGPLVTILRIPMVFGLESPRVQEILTGLKKGAPVLVYRDCYVNVHSDVLLAKQIAYLVANDVEGILHLCSQDVIGYDESMALLTKQLGHEKTVLKYNRIQEQPYYLALRSERDVLPIDLLFSAEQIIQSIE